MTLEPGRLLVLMLLHSCGVYFTMFRQAHQRHILSWAPGFHLGQMLCLRKQSLKCLRKPFLVQELGPILPVVVGGGGPWSPRPCAIAASESEGSAPVTEAGVTGTGRIGKLSPPAKTHTAWARPLVWRAFWRFGKRRRYLKPTSGCTVSPHIRRFTNDQIGLVVGACH